MIHTMEVQLDQHRSRWRPATSLERCDGGSVDRRFVVTMGEATNSGPCIAKEPCKT